MYTIYNKESWVATAKELIRFIETSVESDAPAIGIYVSKAIETNEQFEDLLAKLGAKESDVEEDAGERTIKVVFGPHAIHFFVKRDEAA